MTQKQIAELAGVSVTAVSFWEANCYEPFDLARQRILEFIGFDPYAPATPETTNQQQTPPV